MAAHAMQIPRFTQKNLDLYGAPPQVFNPQISPLITLIDVHKRFKSLEVLKGVELYVKKGDVVVLIGPSGSGKSTLLRCINRLETIQGGDIQFEGRSIVRGPVDINRLRQRIGMVFQHFNLFPHLTVLQNITLGPRYLRKMSTEDANTLAERLLERVGLADKRDAYPDQLSGGQKQRIALARALAKQPEILILDDTTSAVDLETEKQLRKNLQELPYPCTKIIVAQRISAVRSADQILVLQDGRIAQRGTHEQLAACEGYYRDICLLQGVQGMPDAPAANAPAKEVR